jgi:hypothetical protein
LGKIAKNAQQSVIRMELSTFGSKTAVSATHLNTIIIKTLKLCFMEGILEKSTI